jgi:hypothetical protein
MVRARQSPILCQVVACQRVSPGRNTYSGGRSCDVSRQGYPWQRCQISPKKRLSICDNTTQISHGLTHGALAYQHAGTHVQAIGSVLPSLRWQWTTNNAHEKRHDLSSAPTRTPDWALCREAHMAVETGDCISLSPCTNSPDTISAWVIMGKTQEPLVLNLQPCKADQQAMSFAEHPSASTALQTKGSGETRP